MCSVQADPTQSLCPSSICRKALHSIGKRSPGGKLFVLRIGLNSFGTFTTFEKWIDSSEIFPSIRFCKCFYFGTALIFSLHRLTSLYTIEGRRKEYTCRKQTIINATVNHRTYNNINLIEWALYILSSILGILFNKD